MVTLPSEPPEHAPDGELDAHLRKTWRAIAAIANGRTDRIELAARYVAAAAGWQNQSTASRHLKKLCSAGYIEQQARGFGMNGALYRILRQPVDNPQAPACAAPAKDNAPADDNATVNAGQALVCTSPVPAQQPLSPPFNVVVALCPISPGHGEAAFAAGGYPQSVRDFVEAARRAPQATDVVWCEAAGRTPKTLKRVRHLLFGDDIHPALVARTSDGIAVVPDIAEAFATAVKVFGVEERQQRRDRGWTTSRDQLRKFIEDNPTTPDGLVRPLRDKSSSSIEQIRNTVSVLQVAEYLGVEVNSRNQCKAPWHADERTASCQLWEDRFKCFATGRYGDVIQFYRDATGCDVSTALAALSTLADGRAVRQIRPATTKQVLDFSSRLPDTSDLAPWEQRLGVKLPANCRTQGDQLLIPHIDWDAGVTYAVKTRDTDGAKKAWPGSQPTRRLYTPGNCNRGGRTVVIAEGETDSFALGQAFDHKVDVRALPAGAGTFKESWLEELRPFEHVVIVADNDRAGREARDRVTAAVGWLRAERLDVPPLFDDARSAIRHGWRPTHKCLDLAA